MAGVYIHIPVCTQKCHYCDFYSVASPALLDRLIPYYHKEIKHYRSFFPSESLPLRTLYFGGGTPSLCSSQTIGELIQSCERTFPTQWQEITLEANPDDLNPKYLDELLQAGVNRLSIGIQSFNDNWLHKLNRRHSAQQAQLAVTNAQKAGFKNISVDWIYGLPDYSEAQWNIDLEHFLHLGVQHISAYHLSIEEHTVLAKWVQKGLFAEISEEESEFQYLRLIDALRKAGYEHYEISNFCIPGYASLHNSAYWKYEPYLGIGPGAHGFDGKQRYANEHTVHHYLRTMEAEDWHALHKKEILTPTESFNEFVFTGLRTQNGIDAKTLRLNYGEIAYDHFVNTAIAAVRNGNLYQEGLKFRIPEEKWLISNTIIQNFIQ